MKEIKVQRIDLDDYSSSLTLDDFKKLDNFYFEEGDFREYPGSLEVAKNFWEYKKYRGHSSSKPYNWLKEPADYAAIIFWKHNPDYDEPNIIFEKPTMQKITEGVKIFVEMMAQKPGYKLSDFFKPLSCEIDEKAAKTSKQVKNILD